MGKEKELVENALAAEQRLAEAVRKVGRAAGGGSMQLASALPAAAGAATAALCTYYMRRPSGPTAPPHIIHLPRATFPGCCPFWPLAVFLSCRRQQPLLRRWRLSGPPSLQQTPRRRNCSACWRRCARAVCSLLHYCAALAASKPLHTRLLIQPSRFCVSCFGSPCFCFQSVPV